jgi:hypothetical protein
MGDGPDGLRDTPGAVDRALCLYAKRDCAFFERAGQQLPISNFCAGCPLHGNDR